MERFAHVSTDRPYGMCATFPSRPSGRNQMDCPGTVVVDGAGAWKVGVGETPAGYVAGAMFWLTWKVLRGSQVAFTSASRG